MKHPLTDPPFDVPGLLALESTGTTHAELEADVLALFDSFRAPLLRYVYSLGLSPGDAEDVVQDVFVALFVHLRRGGARTNLRGWLFRVSHNLALRRRMQRQRERDRCPDVDAAVRQVPDPRDDPETALADREQRLRAAAVFRALPERDRHCVQLRTSGLRYREIAQVLGISLGAVAKSMARALARLQRASEV